MVKEPKIQLYSSSLIIKDKDYFLIYRYSFECLELDTCTTKILLPSLRDSSLWCFFNLQNGIIINFK